MKWPYKFHATRFLVQFTGNMLWYLIIYFWWDHHPTITFGHLLLGVVTMVIITLISNWLYLKMRRWIRFGPDETPVFERVDSVPLDIQLGRWLWPHLAQAKATGSNYVLDKTVTENVKPRRLCKKCGDRFRPHYAHPVGGLKVEDCIDRELVELEKEITERWPDYVPVDRKIKF